MMTRIQRAKIAYWKWQPSTPSFILGVLAGMGLAVSIAMFVYMPAF